LGSLIGIFKPNAQNNETCILSKLDYCIDSNQILHNTHREWTNTPPTNPKWQMAPILEKKFYRHISAVVWPLLMKFGMVTHIGIQGINSKNSEFLKIQDGGWPPS